MITEETKPLPESLTIPCYACEQRIANHVRRLIVGELTVQVCLCSLCMQMDTESLLNNTVGIEERVDIAAYRSIAGKVSSAF
ncbi:MAG: hypothetical protein KFF50_01295 [Desulfatitalea sp.]|nr:hypothetical protein [Desulfatitalea sp.]